MKKSAKNFFSKEEEREIIDAIKKAEKRTSGEIRVHVENYSKDDVFERAIYWFKKLGMHKTEQRNGVLFYIAIDARKFAILGDVGINQKVPDGFWEEIKDVMAENFKKGEFKNGVVKGILMAGEQLKKYFPYQKNDKNELDDEISYN